MEAFGEVAVRATELLRSRICDTAPAAWETAARAVFPHSVSLRDKNCPRGAYLGLCEEGLVVGVPPGSYTRSQDNRGYAVRAAQLLAVEPSLAGDGPLVLWKRVQEGSAKAHNSQMDVVLALYRHGMLALAPLTSEGGRVGAAREYTAWGTVAGTGAASIDLVLMEASRPLSVREIEDEVRRRGLPSRGAVGTHLNTLKGRGHVISTPAGWCRVAMSSGHAGVPSSPAVPPVAGTPTPAPSLPPPPAAHPAPTEKLPRLKMVLEIGVVAVTLIGGIIALIRGLR